MQYPPKFRMMTVFMALLATLPVQAVPTIDNLVIDPPPQGNWIIAPTTGAPGMHTVRFSFDAKVIGESCTNFQSFGWMNGGRCQHAALPRKLWGTMRSISAACQSPTPEDPATTGKILVFFDASKKVDGAPLELCAVNSAGESTTATFRVSYGQPVKAVKIPKATFSSEKGFLRVQGTVVPKGKTNLQSSEVQLFDDTGNEIATGYINQRKFDLRVPMDVPPASVRAKVINTESPAKIVKLVK